MNNLLAAMLTSIASTYVVLKYPTPIKMTMSNISVAYLIGVTMLWLGYTAFNVF